MWFISYKTIFNIQAKLKNRNFGKEFTSGRRNCELSFKVFIVVQNGDLQLLHIFCNFKKLKLTIS